MRTIILATTGTATLTEAQALLGRGEDLAARTLLERLLATDGSNPDAWYLFGAASHRLGLKDEAIAAYERSLALNPRRAEGHFYLGNLRGERGEHEAAVRCFRRALDYDPQSAAAARNLGATLQLLERHADAIDCYRRFLQRGRPTADILQNLGNALSDLGAPGEAIDAYRAALELDPARAELHVRLGNLHEELGHGAQAMREYERALALDARCIPAWRCLGAALADQGRTEEALECYRRALVTGDAGFRMREATLLPVVARSRQELDEWRARFEAGITRLDEAGLRLDDPPAQAGCPTFLLAYHGQGNRALNTKVGQVHERACPSLTWTAPHCGSRRRGGRGRIGFISRFLYAHSIGKTTLGLVEKLSRDEFEAITLFVPPVRDDDMARRIRAASDQALVIPARLDAARRAIAELELDVLFYQDVAMDPFTYFLAYSRLAPVQCTSFGHPDTTGIGAMDYFVSSDLFEPAGAAEHYSERLFLLRELGTLAYYYRPRVRPSGRDEFGLPAKATLYLCPQTLFKFHPDFDALLGGILRGDAEGRLVLIGGLGRERLESRLAAAMSDVANRIVFLPRQSGEAFSRLVGACDVMLDTLHFNGMNTSLEAFAAGTPVVTLPTGLQRGRHTAGMYRRMEIDEAVARDAQDYVRIAVSLGREPERRAALRARIQERSDVLFEDARVVREFERFFRTAIN